MMSNKGLKLSIVLLYLHRHRVNDIKNFLKSLAKESRIQVVLITSNQTHKHTQDILDTGHQFTLYNIETVEPDFSVPNGGALTLLWTEFRRSYVNFKRRYQKALSIFEKHQNSVLITYDDRMTSLLPLLKASNKIGIPVFLPAVLTTLPDVTATTSNTLKPKRKIESCIVGLIKWCWPGHVNQDGRLFYSPIDYLVLMRFNALSNTPWIKGSLKYTQKLGVESMLAYEKLKQAGVQESKLELTGMPIYDLVDFTRENELDKNILLCALPQYGEHGAMSIQQALPIIEEILESFKSFSGDVIISLHPRMDSSIYQPLVERYGYHCVVGDIDLWLKKASLFFAASSSTTIYSALIMGIPTVALNHVKPRSNIFKDFKSITYIEKSASIEIVDVLSSVRPDLIKLIKEDQKLLSSELVTNGKCGERNLLIIQKLLNA